MTSLHTHRSTLPEVVCSERGGPVPIPTPCLRYIAHVYLMILRYLLVFVVWVTVLPS